MFRRRTTDSQTETDETVIDRPPGPLSQLLVPSSLLDLTLRGLRGYAPAEGLSYWFGRPLDDGTGIAMVAAFPRIYSTERSFELVDGEMGRLSMWAQRAGLWLLAQLHTHPADEPHSAADEEWAASYREGFLSIVIPFSAQLSSIRRPYWRCFERDAEGGWQEIDSGHVHVFDDVQLPGA